jgi:hypothetical protein
MDKLTKLKVIKYHKMNVKIVKVTLIVTISYLKILILMIRLEINLKRMIRFIHNNSIIVIILDQRMSNITEIDKAT